MFAKMKVFRCERLFSVLFVRQSLIGDEEPCMDEMDEENEWEMEKATTFATERKSARAFIISLFIGTLYPSRRTLCMEKNLTNRHTNHIKIL